MCISVSLGETHSMLSAIFSFAIKASYALRDAGEALITTPPPRASAYTVYRSEIWSK